MTVRVDAIIPVLKILMRVASWFDHARDIIALVNHFHAQMPRPIVGVGHSMGGGSLFVSLSNPRQCFCCADRHQIGY